DVCSSDLNFRRLRHECRWEDCRIRSFEVVWLRITERAAAESCSNVSRPLLQPVTVNNTQSPVTVQTLVRNISEDKLRTGYLLPKGSHHDGERYCQRVRSRSSGRIARRLCR